MMKRPYPFQARGFGLLDIMISLLIGLFLLSGLISLFISTQQTYTAQSGIAQLQNSQMMAINIISNIAQSAGYYINPLAQTQNVMLPATAAGVLPSQIALQPAVTISPTPNLAISFVAKQSVFGGSLYANGPDALAIRSVGAMDCTGNISANLSISVLTVSNNNLLCSVNNQNWQVLVNGVSSMSLLYGIDTTASGSITQYVTAGNVTDWSKVMSIRATLSFVNPMYNANAPQGQPAAVSFTRVIGLMGTL